jgi:hypothetical protein
MRWPAAVGNVHRSEAPADGSGGRLQRMRGFSHLQQIEEENAQLKGMRRKKIFL